ncbi:MAG: class I SAM-dependent methyltransferase [Anaerolineae bacterium]
MQRVDLPGETLLSRQADWLRPARAGLLRRAAVARRRYLLDLGAGRGAVTGELVRRGGGLVTALDRQVAALQSSRAFAGAGRVGGDARRLPFADATFDLVFSQLTLLWIAPLARGLDEIHRVLAPGGVLVALEPDYGGMMEYPPEIATRELWWAALRRAGADPCVGRKLPGLLAAHGFKVHVALFDRLLPPDPARLDLLSGLPLTSEEVRRLQRIVEADRRLRAAADHAWAVVAHLPFVLLTAEKREL